MDVSPGPTSVRFPILCIQLKDSLTTLRSFAADYDSSKAIGVPVSNVMDFARSKLVCGCFTGNNMTSEAILACLSVRFALEFDPFAALAGSQEATQIEGHLRLCLRAGRSFGWLLTTAVSEPFLAKAAAQLIPSAYHTGTPVEFLAHGWLDCIDCGQRGELVASLLIM